MSHRKEMIVYGYINQKYACFIPTDIKNLLISFFDEAFCWMFKGEQLKDLLLMKNGKHIVSDEIRYNEDISFWLILYPNGRKSMDGFFQCYLYSKSLPLNIPHCTVSFQLFCIETNTEYKALHKFVRNERKSSGMNYNLRLSQCTDLNQLTFRCIIHLIEIKYECNKPINSDYSVIYYPSTPKIKLQKKCKFEWIVDELLLNRFKTCLSGSRFYSPNFGNWFLDIAPNGDNPSHNGQLQLSLKLWTWPSSLGRVDVMINLSVKTGRHIISKQYRRILSSYGNANKYAHKTSISLYKNYFPSNLLTHFLSFTVHIKILRIYDIYNGLLH